MEKNSKPVFFCRECHKETKRKQMIYYQHNKYLMVLQPYSGSFYAHVKFQKSLFFHHRLQIPDESPQVDFDVVKDTQLLGGVLASPFFTNLGLEDRLKGLQSR